MNVLQKLKEQTTSEWIFASLKIENQPRDSQSIYGKMKKVRSVSMCGSTICGTPSLTTALKHGMDIKTIFAIIGHTSSATIKDIYSHVTDTM